MSDTRSVALPRTFAEPIACLIPGQIVMMGAGGIYLMDADGSNVRQIDPLGDHGGLDWAPR